MTDSILDYTSLRQTGLERLAERSGRQWSDFNAHDPGVTILEQVCYALTDLSYRIHYDLKDLLASNADDPYRSLHRPGQVLPGGPVTLADLRKLALDVEGVKNAWFEPLPTAPGSLSYDPTQDILYLDPSGLVPVHRQKIALRGLLSVLVEVEKDQDISVSTALNARLRASRPLGQDFTFPSVLPSEPIRVTADIEIGTVHNPEQLLAEIWRALANAISPRIRFYTLQEMLACGKSIEDIMQGPALAHGFIDDDELTGMERKPGLRASDLVREIMALNGVRAVNKLSVGDQDWYFKLDPTRAPVFDEDGSQIRLLRGGIPISTNRASVKDRFNLLQQGSISRSLTPEQLDVYLPPVRNRQVGRYPSILRQFPANYGIGALGLPASASPERQAHAKQLKAYLLFFDQLLANNFAQLEHAKDLFSFYIPQAQSYFSQPIPGDDLGLDEILPSDAHVMPDPQAAVRKNRFLDHLLARFGEQFTDYALLLYTQGDQEIIENKSAFLREYHHLGAERGVGFDDTCPVFGSGNIAEIEKRLRLKLGLADGPKRSLADIPANDPGGFHLIEHFLLRPNPADLAAVLNDDLSQEGVAFLAQPLRSDPYSGQISFVFLDSIKDGSRALVEKALREETPVHLHVYLHWLNQDQMRKFETAYSDWLDATRQSLSSEQPNPMDDPVPGPLIHPRLWDPYVRQFNTYDEQSIPLRDARDRMIRILGLGFPYPLRDLNVEYPRMVVYDQTARITIVDAQQDVSYRLCDEDGNPIAGISATNGNTLTTPLITSDITFTILASCQGPNGVLECYLNRPVDIRTGINTSLNVAFSSTNTRILPTDYGATNIQMMVQGTQEGVSYRVVTATATADRSQTLSAGQPAVLFGSQPTTAAPSDQAGNQANLTFTLSQSFTEDMRIGVYAYRTSSPSVFAFLETVLTVNVRPNPAVQVSATPMVVDYNTGTVLTLTNQQSSAIYRLYKRQLGAADYLSTQTANCLVIPNGQGQNIYIQPPEQVTDWNNPAGFTLVGIFQNGLTANSGNLTEDTFFIIQAEKQINGEKRQLNQTLVVLTRPDPAPVLAAQNAKVPSGKTGMITVNNAQAGVSYQLRLDSGNQSINQPGYSQTDRYIGRIRIGVDFKVGQQGESVVLLPTSPISAATTFNVLAVKIRTGVSSQLISKITISPG